MSTIKLDGLSSRELEALIAQASKRKTQLARRKPIEQVRQKLAAMAKAEGYTLQELFGAGTQAKTLAGTRATASKIPPRARGASTRGSKVAPKFRNPDNASQTWAGRGQQPNWLAAEIARGRSLSEFAISPG